MKSTPNSFESIIAQSREKIYSVLTQSSSKLYNEIKERGVPMRQWVIWLTAVALLLVISGCSTEVEGIPIDTESVQPSIEETEPPVILLDNLEYWDVVQDEIVDMLRRHNLYIDIISHAYPCVQFYVEPGILTEDGKTVASGLTQDEYTEVFESVKSDLYMILDKYKIGKPKTIFHGCNSIVEIFFL